MSTHGQIGGFHRDPESWTSHVKQLECNCILMSCCCASAYSLISNLAASNKPKDITHKDLVEKVMSYFAPRSSRIVSRDSSLTHVHSGLVSPLQRMCWSYEEFCEYRETLEDILCDRLVCGLDWIGLDSLFSQGKHLANGHYTQHPENCTERR